jgi:hypothetical protein
MAQDIISPAELSALFSYEPDTGVIRSRKTGKPIGCENDRGYLKWRIRGREYKLHRMAFALMLGAWPEFFVDHVNGIKSDNRWRNLRDVPEKMNTQNQVRPRRDNTSGFLGVSLSRKAGKFRAAIELDGRTRHLGHFSSAEEAHAAYVAAKRRYHEGCTL